MGKFEELVPNEKIVQTWRYSQWPSGHFSNVVIEFIEKVRIVIILLFIYQSKISFFYLE